MEHMALQKTLGMRGHEGRSLTESQKKPRGLKLLMSKTSALFSPKEGEKGGMNNTIKRRQGRIGRKEIVAKRKGVSLK